MISVYLLLDSYNRLCLFILLINAIGCTKK